MKKLVLFLVCSFAMMAAIAQSVNSNTNKDGVVTDTKNNVITEYKGPCACLNPIASDVFERLLSDIKAGKTNHNRYIITRREIADKCLLTSQVEQIFLVFTKNYSRNAFLNLASDHTYDLNNFYEFRSKNYYNNSVTHTYHGSTPTNELNTNFYMSNARLAELQREFYYYGSAVLW